MDPLDGTREFLSRNGQFTVNIALIDSHAPVLGVVHVPVSDVSYRGLPGAGAWRVAAGEPARAIRVSATSAAPLRVVGSRSHRGDSLDGFLARLGPHELEPMGSSLKFCLVAEGAADVYPRLGPTSEWDTAAAHAVLAGAGGTVVDLGGAPLRYNTKAQLLNPFFVAYGSVRPRLAASCWRRKPVPVRSHVHKHVAEVVLDYPPINALDGRAWRELARVVTEVAARGDVRCLLLRGRGTRLLRRRRPSRRGARRARPGPACGAARPARVRGAGGVRRARVRARRRRRPVRGERCGAGGG